MKPLTLAAWVLFMMGTPSRAGMVLFDPPSITITPGTQSVSFETRAMPENLKTFDTVSVIIGSLDGLSMSFQFDAAFPCHWCVPPAEQGIYAALTGDVGNDLGIGGNNFSLTPWTSVELGVLTVDTSTLVAGDVRQILVSPELESELFGDPEYYVSSLLGFENQEPLRGAVTITVVPEPATMVLVLSLGAAIYVRERKMSK